MTGMRVQRVVTGSPGGRGGLYRRLVTEISAADLPTGPASGNVVTAADLTGLPATVQRYLRFMAVLGQPRDRSFRVRLAGRFRLRPGSSWMPMQAWQYNSAVQVARAATDP